MTSFSPNLSKKEFSDTIKYQLYSLCFFYLVVIFVAIDLLLITPFGLQMGYVEVSSLVSRVWEEMGYHGLVVMFMINTMIYISILSIVGIFVGFFKGQRVAWMSIVFGEVILLVSYFIINLLNIITLKYA